MTAKPSLAAQAVVLTAQPGNLGSDRIGGQRRSLAVEGIDLVRDGEVCVGDGAVGDPGVPQGHVEALWPSMGAWVSLLR